MNINKKKKEYEKYIKEQKLENIKRVDLLLQEEETQELYIEGFLLKEDEGHLLIYIGINKTKKEEEIKNEIEYMKNVYEIKTIKNKEDYIDFVFYHEWGHVLQQENWGDLIRNEENRTEVSRIMERMENGEITEEEADKLYRNLWFERDADEFAMEIMKKRNKDK